MQRILAHHLSSHPHELVRVAGWIHRRRLLGGVAFLVLRERTGLVQAVIREPGVRAQVEALPEETAVAVTGRVTPNPAAPGGFELTEPTIEPLTDPAAPSPLELFRPALGAGLPVLLDHAAVAVRHESRRLALTTAAGVLRGFRAALGELGFTEISTPKVVGSATESGAGVFAVDYFGTPAYLAQSPQLHKQMLVGSLERVFEVGPVFRAEPHDTGRHLAQYTSLDAELGFIDGHEDVMAVVRAAVAGMVGAAAVPGIEVPQEIPSVDFTAALELVGAGLGEDLTGEPDLAPAHERWLGGWAAREHGSEFLFVTGYPMVKRPFYTHPMPSRPGISASFDLLFRGLEVATGGQRLHRHGDYLAALAARGESAEPYAGYLAAFAHGMPPHGGFGLGLERFVARLLGLSNVRLATAFPRDRYRLTP
jgi:nondiscriminating aspartyl-tRNA synthetase